MGQLLTALGKENSGTNRLLEQFGYAYDTAGNLNFRTNNALLQTFNVNNLNELATITRSGVARNCKFETQKLLDKARSAGQAGSPTYWAGPPRT
jgi:hypothetical protein